MAHLGEFVDLVREPNNPYDRNAIRVDNLARQQVGLVWFRHDDGNKKKVENVKDAHMWPLFAGDSLHHRIFEGAISTGALVDTVPWRRLKK